MTKSHRSSSASAGCRLEWRPSVLLVAALILITLLAALSLLVSGMPQRLAWPATVAAAWFGLRTARSQWNRPTVQLVFPGDGLPAVVDGQAVEGMCIEWRGPLAFAQWNLHQGEVRRLAWWPDTLPAAKRRELRLAASCRGAARQRP